MTQPGQDGRLTVVIASPLEDEQVARIRDFAPDRVRVVHEPAFLGTPRYAADHVGVRRPLDADERARWLALVAEADILFDFDREIAAELPRLAPRLRWVQATSAGIGEFIERTGLAASEITFTTAAGVHARPLAEFTLLGLLHFFRDLPHLEAAKARRHWERYTVEGLDGKRALVVGLGAVGREIARCLAALGVEVGGLLRGDPGRERPEGVAGWVAPGDLRRALAETDALVLACPLTTETRGLIGAAEIAALKVGAVFVNVARGPVVDEAALIAALAEGRLRGAALDVFAVEPLPQDSPLWAMPNVIVSPHSASTVAAENGRIVDIFLDNLGRFLDGRPLRNLYDRARGY